MYTKNIITEDEVKKIKEANPGVAIFKLPNRDIGDVIFKPIYKDLAREIAILAEKAKTQAMLPPLEITRDKIFDSCVLWPSFTQEEKDSLPAGTIPSVVKSIEEKSGYFEIDVLDRILGPDVMSSTIKDFSYWDDITPEEIIDLKEKNNCQLFKVRIDGWVFIIQPMTRVHLRISEQANDNQLALSKLITLWPTEVDWDSIPAGCIEILVRQAYKLSGWDLGSEAVEL